MLVGSLVAETGVYPAGMHHTVNWSACGAEVAAGGGVVGVAGGGKVGATVGLGGREVGRAVGTAGAVVGAVVAAGAMLVAAGAAVGVLLAAQADVKRTGRTINANKMSLAALLLNIFSSLVFLLE